MPTEILVHRQPSPAALPAEVVERKGLGHPDTLADALAERMSVAYSHHCRQQFGAILHHNLDKLYLRGGHARTDLGHFEMTAPVTLVIGGRVSTRFADTPIDHQTLFTDIACDYLGRVLPHLDTRRWLRIEHATTDRSRYPTWFHPRSRDDLPELTIPTASDTVAVTAWWPHTPTERLVLALERHLNREGAGPRHRHIGQDIKIMAVRRGNTIDVTCGIAVHPAAAPTVDAHHAVLDQLRPELNEVASTILDGNLTHQLFLDTQQVNPYLAKRQYLLGSGSCLEFGEEGFVGRGNGASGLIAVHRPKSVEAPFGKNPTYHAGKVYTLYADQIARAVHATTTAPATVTIVANHSAPLRHPALVDIALHADASPAAVRRTATAVLETTDHVALAVDHHTLVPR